VIGAVNLFILTIPFKEKIKFKDLLRYSYFSWSYGLFLPGKVGEFSLVYFLKNEGVDMGKTLALSFIDKINTILVVGIFSGVGIFLLLSNKAFYFILFFLFFGMIVSILTISSNNIRKIIRDYILRSYAKKFKGFFRTFKSYFFESLSFLILNFLVTILKWFFNALSIYFIFRGFGISIDIIWILLLTSITILLSLVPISLSGLGVRESAAIYLYLLIGVKSEITASVYLIL
jgi:hypothetical protein